MKERILNKDKELGNIIDIKNNHKAKDMNIGQQNIIFKQRVLRLLESEIKVSWKNWSVESVEYQSNRMS